MELKRLGSKKSSLTGFSDVLLHGQFWVKNESKVPGRIREGDVVRAKSNLVREGNGGRFHGRRKGNEKSFVLLSLSWFSVICACKYVNQWDKTTIWSMMQIYAIKGINLLHGGWHKRAVKKMKLWYGVWHKHNVQSWGYNYGVWHKRMCCAVKVIQPWSMTQSYLQSWGYNDGAFMTQTRAVKGVQLMNYWVLEYDKNTCVVEGNVTTKL